MWVCDIRRVESAEEGIGGNGAEGHMQRFSFTGGGHRCPHNLGAHILPCRPTESTVTPICDLLCLIWDLLICEVKRQSVSLSAVSDSL